MDIRGNASSSYRFQERDAYQILNLPGWHCWTTSIHHWTTYRVCTDGALNGWVSLANASSPSFLISTTWADLRCSLSQSEWWSIECLFSSHHRSFFINIDGDSPICIILSCRMGRKDLIKLWLSGPRIAQTICCMLTTISTPGDSEISTSE